MKNKLYFIILILFSNLLFFSVSYAQTSTQQVEEILTLKEAPAGVVFEVVTGATNSLKWALPQIQRLIKKLHDRFPNLEIAIVTHGTEQFALQTKNKTKYKKVHSLTQQLLKEKNIQLQVCGTYAGWKNVDEEDFPDYVNVAAEGPAAINDYISLGYILITL